MPNDHMISNWHLCKPGKQNDSYKPKTESELLSTFRNLLKNKERGFHMQSETDE